MNVAIVSMFVMVIATGALLILTPRLMPQTECFAVTVPHGARSQEPLVGYERSYMRTMLAIVVLCALAWPIAFVVGALNTESAESLRWLTGLTIGTTCVPMIASLALMLYYRRRVQGQKAAQAWQVSENRSVAFVGPEDFPRPLPLWSYLVFLPLIAAMAAFALTHYTDVPERIPLRMDSTGTVSDYAPRSLVSVLFPVFTTAFLGALFALSHWGIIRSKKPINPSAPASTALAYARFARIQSIVLFAGGVCLSVVLGGTYFASALGAISLQEASTAVLVTAVVFIVAVLVATLKLGQVGALVAASTDDDTMACDDDKFWRLGMFYCNANDPSIVVPKRFGVGWTFNIARPGAWAILVVLILLITGFYGLVALMDR